jgi:hypothetical protein
MPLIAIASPQLAVELAEADVWVAAKEISNGLELLWGMRCGVWRMRCVRTIR